MIQRIQTIYLLIIAILGISTAIFPIETLIGNQTHLTYLMDYRGVNPIIKNQELNTSPISTNWTLTSFALVFSVLSVINIFSYKNRLKQISLSKINFGFMFGYYVLLFFSTNSASKTLDATWHLSFWCCLPLIAAIFNYLAVSAIKKDEKLVKSLDRIR